MRIALLALTLSGCGAVDTVSGRLEDAAADLRRAGGRFVEHLGAYLEAEGCAYIRRQVPIVPILFNICEDA